MTDRVEAACMVQYFQYLNYTFYEKPISAIAGSKYSPDFTCFLDLPAEIRIMIWEQALAVPKLLCLVLIPQSNTLVRSFDRGIDRRSVQDACRESRQVWTSLRRRLPGFGGVHLNPSLDTVWIQHLQVTHHSGHRMFGSTLPFPPKAPESLQYVKKIAVAFSTWSWLCQNAERVQTFLAKMPLLREVVIVLVYRVDDIDPIMCADQRMVASFLGCPGLYVRLSELPNVGDLLKGLKRDASVAAWDDIFTRLKEPPNFTYRFVRDGHLEELLDGHDTELTALPTTRTRH